MNKKNQIILIEEFIGSNEETLVINQVNDEIAIFYLSIIKYYANNQAVKVDIDTYSDTKVFERDLFGTKIIQIYNVTNAKKLDVILDVHSKKIIFRRNKNHFI